MTEAKNGKETDIRSLVVDVCTREHRIYIVYISSIDVPKRIVCVCVCCISYAFGRAVFYPMHNTTTMKFF